MSHQIEFMMSVREKPWFYNEETKHLANILPEAPTSEEALKLSGLDFDVFSEKMYDEQGQPVEGFRVNKRSTDGKHLGVVRGRYTIVQNREAFAFTDAIINTGGVRYETAGSLNGGSRVWMMARMPESKILGDKVDNFLVFLNSFDGSEALKVFTTNVRCVCNNTISLALKTTKRSWAMRHTKKVEEKLLEAEETLKLYDKYMIGLDKEAQKLALKKFTNIQIENFWKQLFPYDEDDSERRKTVSKEQIAQLEYCYNREDLNNFRGTGWGIMNAVADYVDHGIPMRQTPNWEENRWDKILSGNTIFEKAYELVQAY